MGEEYLKRLVDSIDELKEGQNCLQKMVMEIKIEFGKVEERLRNGSRRFEETDRKFDDLEERVRKMENKISVVYAVAAVISTLAAISTQILSFFMKGGR